MLYIKRIYPRKITKQSHFEFGPSGDTAFIFLKKTFSNIFITFADQFRRTVICRTSGSSGIIGSKRRKRVPYAIENIVKELNVYFKLYEIKNVRIILKMRLNRFFYFLTRELVFHGLKVIKVYFRRRVAFNGVRGRKLRRV